MIYTVEELKLCECGHFSIWLGDMKNTENIGVIECAGCGQKTYTQKLFIGAKCFIPLDDFKEVTFKEIEEPISAQ